jgi:lipopolysaccharide/colanic/teichoic acid biosynthesis glycosyltransferase
MSDGSKENIEKAKNYLPHVRKVGWFYYGGKRVFDFVSALLLFVLLIPLFFILGLCVFVSSRGPIFYKDVRVGKNGKTIKLLKFRSMYPDAQEHPEKYFNETQMEEWRTERKVENDPRITPFGNFIRKTSLDELPQLLNIMGGSLSVVGPRAITQAELDTYYSDEQKVIFLSAKPGLTGYWQVHGRNDARYETGERTILEMTYFEKRRLLYDFGLIFATIPALFKHQGE